VRCVGAALRIGVALCYRGARAPTRTNLLKTSESLRDPKFVSGSSVETAKRTEGFACSRDQRSSRREGRGCYDAQRAEGPCSGPATAGTEFIPSRSISLRSFGRSAGRISDSAPDSMRLRFTPAIFLDVYQSDHCTSYFAPQFKPLRSLHSDGSASLAGSVRLR
jgi:hypothetical protein